MNNDNYRAPPFAFKCPQYLYDAMTAAARADYCRDYPHPRVVEGRRRLWLRDDLDAAIAPGVMPNDLAEDL